jgi:hypothetical protein
MNSTDIFLGNKILRKLLKRLYPKVSGLALLERELRMVEISATRCSFIAIL